MNFCRVTTSDIKIIFVHLVLFFGAYLAATQAIKMLSLVSPMSTLMGVVMGFVSQISVILIRDFYEKGE